MFHCITPIFFGNIDTFSVDEVADAFGVDSRTVRHWVESGELAAFSVSKNPNSQKPRLRITEDELTLFRERRSTRPVVKSSRRRKRRTPPPTIL